MRYLAAFGAILAAAFASPAFAQSFLGEWTATAHVPGGGAVSETVQAVKTGDGYAITGKAIDPAPGAPDAGPGTNIVLDGDKFTYKRALTPDGSIKLTYTGVVSGDAFTGTAEVGGTEIPYTGVRVRTGK